MEVFRFIPALQNLATRHCEGLCRGQGGLNSLLISNQTRGSSLAVCSLNPGTAWALGKDHLNLFFQHATFPMPHCVWQDGNGICSSPSPASLLAVPQGELGAGARLQPVCSKHLAQIWVPLGSFGCMSQREGNASACLVLQNS